MAPLHIHRPHTQRISALALATLSLASWAVPAPAQTVYREYDDGHVDTFRAHRGTYGAPLRRRPSADEDDDERFERDLPEDDGEEDIADDRQGQLDLSQARKPAPTPALRAPEPPPSVNAKPEEKAWKPAL